VTRIHSSHPHSQGFRHVADVRSVLRGGGVGGLHGGVQQVVGVTFRDRQAGGEGDHPGRGGRGVQQGAARRGQEGRRVEGQGREGNRRREDQAGGEGEGRDREAGGVREEARRAEGGPGRQVGAGAEGRRHGVRGVQEVGGVRGGGRGGRRPPHPDP